MLVCVSRGRPLCLRALAVDERAGRVLVAVGEGDRVFAGLGEADGAFARRRVRHGIPVFLAALPLFLGNVVVFVGVVPV